jgi:hypothetical protein
MQPQPADDHDKTCRQPALHGRNDTRVHTTCTLSSNFLARRWLVISTPVLGAHRREFRRLPTKLTHGQKHLLSGGCGGHGGKPAHGKGHVGRPLKCDNNRCLVIANRWTLFENTGLTSDPQMPDQVGTRVLKACAPKSAQQAPKGEQAQPRHGSVKKATADENAQAVVARHCCPPCGTATAVRVRSLPSVFVCFSST